MLSIMESDRTLLTDMQAQILDLERSPAALREEKMLVQERLDSYNIRS